MGIIETLSAGFNMVRKRLWLILLPVLLDIGLWIAPRLSIVSLTRDALQLFMVPAAAAGPETLSSMKETVRIIEQMAENTDLLSLLSSSLLGMPSLPVTDATSFFGLPRTAVELQGGLDLALLVPGLSLIGLLIGVLYLGLIAQQVRDGRADWLALGRCLPRYWLRLVGVSLLLIGVFVFLALPLTIMLSIFGLLSQSLASMLMALLSFVLLWVLIYLTFVPEAILYSDDSILRAIWHSFGVVRYNFWSTLGLLVLANIITTGLMFVWQPLTRSAPGALLAIVGNAYIGTGLTAAMFIFYRDRLRAWQAIGEQRRSER